jgi:glutamine amidotransferase
MLTVLVDYDSGNLHSAEKAFQRMAIEADGGDVLVTSQPEDVARADRIVLPGDGAFPACRDALMRDRAALYEAIVEAVTIDAKPFLGICVGMQMMATLGRRGDCKNHFQRRCAESAAYGVE